jgi:hypothetical protein
MSKSEKREDVERERRSEPKKNERDERWRGGEMNGERREGAALHLTFSMFK